MKLTFVDAGVPMSIEQRIAAKFIERIRSDSAIPPEVADRISALCKEGRLRDVDAVLNAIRGDTASLACPLPTRYE